MLHHYEPKYVLPFGQYSITLSRFYTIDMAYLNYNYSYLILVKNNLGSVIPAIGCKGTISRCILFYIT